MLTVVLQMNLFNAVAFTDPRAALEAARATARLPHFGYRDA